MSIGIPVYGVLSDMVSVDKAESLVSHEQSKIKDASIKKITHFFSFIISLHTCEEFTLYCKSNCRNVEKFYDLPFSFLRS